jgi:hypothetical protein
VFGAKFFSAFFEDPLWLLRFLGSAVYGFSWSRSTLGLWTKWSEVMEMGHIGYGWLLMDQMTWNSRFDHLGALNCRQYMIFVDQVTMSVWNGAHWVRMTAYRPNDLEFEIQSSRGTILKTVHEFCRPNQYAVSVRNGNLRFKYIGAVDCGQYMKFVDQVTENVWNRAHWVRMTLYSPYDLKFNLHWQSDNNEFVIGRTLWTSN